ncbi:MAG: energy-coupling factor transporter ATPase [Lachnospiraceae bacterium]|nr:energy-coupling factor transporter ATPase [Lachnospiraceae bacterium]
MSIKLENVNYIYEDGTINRFRALKDINLEVNDGEFVGLIGHTGSGKSTLIQHFNGLVKPTEGVVSYNGEDIFGEKYNRKNLRLEVGLVFQYPEHQLFEAEVLQDVAFGPRNQGLSETEALIKAKEALALVGIGENYYNKSPFELSGGEKRKVAIAGILAMEPKILILDEPTAGLDPKGRDNILELLKRIHGERKITVILVSHSMEDIAKYVDRMIVMNKGSIMYDDSPKKIFRYHKELEEIGLAAPQITYLMQRLKESGYDVDENATTIEEALKGLNINA